MYYIQEADKPSIFFRLFNVIQLKEDKIILPMDEKEITSKKAQRLAKKTKKILDQAISKKIVISEKIQKQEEYVNYLHSYNFEMIEGKWLFEVLANKILERVLEKSDLKKEETSISILMNDITDCMLFHLKDIIKEYKRVNIVTNHIEKFKRIEEQILEEEGIVLVIGNNKRKSLLKSELILNVDFPSELINQYSLYEKAIIINIRSHVKIHKKRFNGISIQDYEIAFNHPEEFDYDKNTKYRDCKIYEAQINKRQPIQEIMKQIEKDKVKVTKLIGTRTIL